jgi:hypothetical protein
VQATKTKKTNKKIGKKQKGNLVPCTMDATIDDNIDTTTWEADSLDQPLDIVLIGNNFLDIVWKGYKNNPFLGKVVGNISHYLKFSLKDGLLKMSNPVKQIVVCIPGVLSKGRRVTEIAIDQAHRIIGHKMARKTLDYIRRWYWWLKMTKDIDLFYKSRGSCQTTKSLTHKPIGLLHSLPIPSRP